MGFQIANEPDADRVLDEYPFAVLVGMMLDQQYGMEHAFRSEGRPAAGAGTDLTKLVNVLRVGTERGY